MLTRRCLITGTAAALGAGVAGAEAHAGRMSGVSRVIMLTSATPDTPPDRICRAFAAYLQSELGSTDVVVTNLPGEAGLRAMVALASGTVTPGDLIPGDMTPGGMTQGRLTEGAATPGHSAATHAPDALTLGWVASPTMSARMVDRSAEPVIARLKLVGAVEREPIAFVSPAATPISSVQEIIRRAAEDADSVPFGTPPAGSPAHLVALRLQLLTQTRLNIVTFPSAGAVLQAAISGNVAAAALGLSDAIGGLREDKLSGIGITAHNRAGMLPDLPALREAGVPLSGVIRRGLAVSAETPPDVVARLAQALQAIAIDPAFKDHADEAGFVPVWIDGPAWAAQVAQERADLAALWASEPWLNSNGG